MDTFGVHYNDTLFLSHGIWSAIIFNAMKNWIRQIENLFLAGITAVLGISCNRENNPPALSFHLVNNQTLYKWDDDVDWPPEPTWTFDTNAYMRCVRKSSFGEELLWVLREPILTKEDLAGVEVRVPKCKLTAKDIDQWNVEHPDQKCDLKELQKIPPPTELHIEFSESGARRLQKVTQEHKNERMAIMNGQQIILAPKIFSEITDGGVIVEVRDMTEKELRKLFHVSKR